MKNIKWLRAHLLKVFSPEYIHRTACLPYSRLCHWSTSNGQQHQCRRQIHPPTTSIKVKIDYYENQSFWDPCPPFHTAQILPNWQDRQEYHLPLSELLHCRPWKYLWFINVFQHVTYIAAALLVPSSTDSAFNEVKTIFFCVCPALALTEDRHLK